MLNKHKKPYPAKGKVSSVWVRQELSVSRLEAIHQPSQFRLVVGRFVPVDDIALGEFVKSRRYGFEQLNGHGVVGGGTQFFYKVPGRNVLVAVQQPLLGARPDCFLC